MWFETLHEVSAEGPGVNVSTLARAHGLSPQQVFGWRRKALADVKARTEAPIRRRRGAS